MKSGDAAFKEFLSGIRFEGCDPLSDTMSYPRQSDGAIARESWRRWPDALITRLPQDDTRYRRLLAPLLDLRRMSSFAIAAIINFTVSRLEPGECYLNIGTWRGFSLLAGMIGHENRRVIGVDNFSKWGGPRDDFLQNFDTFRSPWHRFFEADYRDYFAGQHDNPIGLYFYDGDHEFKHQLEGLRIAEPWFAPGCVILVDDTNRPEPYEASLEYIRTSGYSYEILLDQKTASDGHPTYWNGILVFRRTG